ncbi:uncharacterized protein [Triticum aestivum]|uniref:uncharacterized protein isoform X1 n=1 Tax=Triticum aestivum TaxID=4565 RepID=UPI001D02DD7D|nr:uncharacterized protein LOC123147853 isoform X1 [Triticum aestivum]
MTGARIRRHVVGAPVRAGRVKHPEAVQAHPQPSLSPALLPLFAPARSPPRSPPTSPTAASPWCPGLMTTAARTLTSTPTQLQTRASSRPWITPISRALNLMLCAMNSLPAERRVAFQGIHTGRRFLACAVKEGRNCGLVEWVDPFWPATMENALTKLWDKYEECRRSKIEDNLESSFAVHNLTQQKIKLQASYERLVEDVNGLLDAQEQRAQME